MRSTVNCQLSTEHHRTHVFEPYNYSFKFWDGIPVDPIPLLATVEAENSPIVMSGVLLSLVVIYIASKIGAEVALKFDFPPVLGELVAGVIIGISALHLIVFPGSGLSASNSGIMTVLQSINHLSPAALTSVFESQSEVICSLAELGVIVLLFEIGLESDSDN